MTFESNPPGSNADACYTPSTNIIKYHSNSNTQSDEYIEDILRHELNHYNDLIKIAFIILLTESNSPLIKESDKKFIEFYKKEIISQRNAHPNAKEINSRINRKVKKYC